MVKFLLFGIVGVVPLMAQEDRPVRYFPTDPSGTCSVITPMWNNWRLGKLWQCVGSAGALHGTWQLISSSAPLPGGTLDVGSYSFSESPVAGGSITAGVAKTVTLVPCPNGLAGSDTSHYVYISGGTGTAEAVLITGGTCTSGAATGTIVFTSAYNHTGAWTVASATNGCQEAVNSAGTYGSAVFAAQVYEFYAPCTVVQHVSLEGQGMDVTLLHNNSATTGVLRYVSPYAINASIAGAFWHGFTIYAGSTGNTAVNTSVSDAVYIQDPNWNFTMSDVFIKNHAIGVHQVNGWSTMYRNVNIRFFRDYGFYTEVNGNVGSGVGADQFIESSSISEATSTGTVTDSGCAIRYANWAGIFLHQITTTGTKRGLCLQPRAPTGVESYTSNYYGTISDSHFDTSEHEGIRIDSTNNKVSDIRFTNIITAFNGCLAGADCSANPFTNAAPGILFVGGQTQNISFIGGVARENGGHGVDIGGTPAQVTFSGFDADSNSQAADNTYDGFHIGNSVFDVRINSAFTGKVNTILSRTPRYGVFVGTGGDNMQIANVRFVGNATGTMSYGGGVNSLLGPNWPYGDPVINNLKVSTVTYAQLAASPYSSAPDGSQYYCSNCNATCSGVGSVPTMCFREGGVWNGHGTGGGGGGGSVFTGSTAVTSSFSATPTFSLADVSVKSPVRFEPAALTANVTSVTFTNKTAGAQGSIAWLQDGTGSRTVTYGVSMSNGCTLNPAANSTTLQHFVIAADGATVIGTSCDYPGVSYADLPCIATPATPGAGTSRISCNSTSKKLTNVDDVGLVSMTVVPKDCNALNAGDLVKSIDTAGVPQCITPTVKLTCQPGLGDGLNAIPAGTYLETTCFNMFGATYTITGIRCFTDNAGTSTLNATNGAGTGLLTGTILCNATIPGAAGTQTGTVTIAANDAIKFTFVSDGSSKQTSWVITGTR